MSEATPRATHIYAGKPSDGGYAGRRVLVLNPESLREVDSDLRLKVEVRIENAPSVGKPEPVWSKKTVWLPGYLFGNGVILALDCRIVIDRDSVGQYGWHCIGAGCFAEASGFETVPEVVAAAEEHAPLAIEALISQDDDMVIELAAERAELLAEMKAGLELAELDRVLAAMAEPFSWERDR